MARASSQSSQSSTNLNSVADHLNLAALIDQCSRDVRCGLSFANNLCQWMHAPYRFRKAERIDRETAEWLTVSVKQLLDHYRAANETFPIVGRLLRANSDRTCAHDEAIIFTGEVRIVFVVQQSESGFSEMTDVIVNHWPVIRDFLLKLKRPDFADLSNRITVESAKAIESKGRRIAPPDGVHAGQKMLADGPTVPDGFRLNGIEVLGLAEDWQKVLTFVWERSGDPPKWQDVATHLGVFAQMDDVAFRKLIYKINQRTKDDWPETLQTVRGRVVLRPPVRGRTKAPRKKTKTGSAKKSARKVKRSSASKSVGTEQPMRNKRATKK